MKSKVLGLLAAGMLTAPFSAGAVPVSWLIEGRMSLVSGTADPIITVGDVFSFTLNFDTDTPVSNPFACGVGGDGTTCRHDRGLTQSFTNLVIDGQAFGDFFASPLDNNYIIVRNNASVTGEGIVDGYTFGSQENYAGNTRAQSLSVIFRGPEDLGLVTDGRFLPADPPPGLLGLRTRLLQFCDGNLNDRGALVDCSGALLQGSITSVRRVPEPGTLALLGLGLAGLGLSRRRRA